MALCQKTFLFNKPPIAIVKTAKMLLTLCAVFLSLREGSCTICSRITVEGVAP